MCVSHWSVRLHGRDLEIEIEREELYYTTGAGVCFTLSGVGRERGCGLVRLNGAGSDREGGREGGRETVI